MASGVFFWGIIGLTLSMAGLFYALHRFARPDGSVAQKASDALRELEPRGGRHRFSLRLFEIAVLSALWVSAAGLLWLWSAAAHSLPPVADAALGMGTVSVGVLTWWSWRRGVLRPAQTLDHPARGQGGAP